MRTAWILVGALLGFMTIGGCGDSQEPLEVAGLEAASAPIVVPLFLQFDDINPCSGLVHTITVTGTARILERDGLLRVQDQKTITTSSGFTGRGTDMFVDNGNIQRFTLNDMLTNESGDRIRAHLVLVVDLSTTPPTVRVMQGTFDEVICVGA
jgi:hypothetical protein